MAQKIVYTDEDGEIEVIENAPRAKDSKVHRTAREALVPILAISILMGAIGGVAGTVVASSNPTLRHALGVIGGSSTISTVRTDKLVVQESSAIIDAAKNASPAVVSISSKKNVTGYFGQDVTQEADGTGFIITNDGLIVTNKHVVSDPSATYTVVLTSGKSYSATVLAQDPLQDLAVIKIDATGLPIVDLGNSNDVEVGQYVTASGNALGQFQNSVTVGVISAKNREIQAGDESNSSTETLQDLFQTDAAINQGNSGGPLLNLKGQVIGMNTAIAAKGQAEGIGFAIPINDIKASINQVKQTGKISRPYLGVMYVPLTNDIAKANNLKVNYGAYLVASQGQSAVIAGGPADEAGLRTGDIITKIDDDTINADNSLTSILGKYSPNEKVKVTIVRDSDTKVLEVKLGEAK